MTHLKTGHGKKKCTSSVQVDRKAMVGRVPRFYPSSQGASGAPSKIGRACQHGFPHLSLREQLRSVVLGDNGLGDLIHNRRQYPLVVVWTPRSKTSIINKRLLFD